MAAMWAILAVVGGGAGFAAGLNHGFAAAFVSAFVGAWLLTGAGVAAMLLRSTQPEDEAQADAGDDEVVEIDLDRLTDQMVATLRGALEAAERHDGVLIHMNEPVRACA